MLKNSIILIIIFHILFYSLCYGVIDNRKSCLEACEVFDGDMQLCCFNCCYNNFEIGK